MSRIVETTVFRLDELSDGAKEQARAWYRETDACDDWYECVFDDFEVVCAILGIRLKTRSVRLFGGGTRQKPCIWFSGFASQGDGACFEGAYCFATGARKNFTASLTPCRRSSAATSISSAPTPISAGAVATNIA